MEEKKVRSIGVSNYEVIDHPEWNILTPIRVEALRWQPTLTTCLTAFFEVRDLVKLLDYAKIKPVTVQNKLDPYLMGEMSHHVLTKLVSPLDIDPGPVFGHKSEQDPMRCLAQGRMTPFYGFAMTTTYNS